MERPWYYTSFSNEDSRKLNFFKKEIMPSVVQRRHNSHQSIQYPMHHIQGCFFYNRVYEDFPMITPYHQIDQSM